MPKKDAPKAKAAEAEEELELLEDEEDEKEEEDTDQLDTSEPSDSEQTDKEEKPAKGKGKGKKSRKSDKTEKKKRGRCRGCLKGCLFFILIIVVIIGVTSFFLFKVPQRLGLMGAKAEKHFVLTPEREGGTALLAEVQRAGLSTQGIDLFVFPMKEGEDSVAMVVLDDSEGFSFTKSGGLSPLADIFVKVASSSTAEDLKISRVAVVYITEDGNQLMNLTAPKQAIMNLANRSITEEQFMNDLDGSLNFPVLMQEQYKSLNRMFQ